MKHFIVLLLSFLLLACVKKEQPSIVIAGMSQTEVLQIEGTPTDTATHQQYDLLFYAERQLPNQPNLHAEQAFIFIDNKLIEYSTINIRPIHEKDPSLGLNAQQILTCWVNQLNLPVNPSAIANKDTITNGSDCFSKLQTKKD